MPRRIKQQALVEAPVEAVWELLADPSRYPEWNEHTVEVTGAPTEIERGTTYDEVGRGPLGIRGSTTFEVEELDDLRQIKLRCQKSGYYSRWLLTEARGDTFLDLEMGVEPLRGLKARALGVAHHNGYLRRTAEYSLDGLRRVLRRARSGSAGSSTA
jgi:uncharacterized protein YndB with AHSA1/START domain